MKNSNDDARKTLVAMLREASKLEHCLLNTYLYAACSVKTLPHEFEVALPLEKPNVRRAIQFERARAWKQSLLMVAHEEMLHLHYVQCLLRALGEHPYFGLPDRNQEGNWTISNWKAQIGEKPVGQGEGVDVPVGPLTLEAIKRFVVYESTDALQDNDPFGAETTALFEQLAQFELEFKLASTVLQVADPVLGDKIKNQLSDLYTSLTPIEKIDFESATETELTRALPPVKSIAFQSIADFYLQGILPLYEQAFDMGWVKNNNRDLNNELQDPNYAGEGFLPIGPIPRTQRFQKQSAANTNDPLRNYKSARSIIEEIVEEGEGFSKFDVRVKKWLDEVSKSGGAEAYLKLLMSRKPSPLTDEGEQIRQSHLYRFGLILTQMKQETSLSKSVGVRFSPSRIPENTSSSVVVSKIVRELPAWFNSCYVVMLAWLGRIYETHDWYGDKSRRQAIEMLASWPLMSLAIRPFLELASFLDVDTKQLFRTDSKSLPTLPLNALQLHGLLEKQTTCQADEERIDYFAIRVLRDAANWAETSLSAFRESDIDVLDEATRSMIKNRLEALTKLAEFEKQFPFRQHGGYSSRLPDLSYTQSHPDGEAFAENPSSFTNGVFNQTLALRLRFSGRGLVQLATDPDPPTDEAGCTGTHMLHPADGAQYFDRRLVWQPAGNPKAILREPANEMLPLGVDCVEAAVLVAPNSVSAGYSPLQVMNSTGAVQTSGLQQELAVNGFVELASFSIKDLLGPSQTLGVELLAKQNKVPLLLGENHLVWQDGEPIDPFVFSVLNKSVSGIANDPWITREVYNQDKTMLEMSPLQRALSSRSPCGFDSIQSIPEWARSPELNRDLSNPAYPKSYLKSRAELLAATLSPLLPIEHATIDAVDQVISFAERMQLVCVPRGTTMGWLTVILHYGHTLSGSTQVAPTNPLLAALSNRLDLDLAVPQASAEQAKTNNSWLLNYTMGMMDTDALSCHVFGELYVPLTAASKDEVTLHHDWRFAPEMVSSLAKYAISFGEPFWAPYQVSGQERTVVYDQGSTLTETLVEKSDGGYKYEQKGLAGVADCKGSLELSSDVKECKLTWTYKFRPTDPSKLMSAVAYFANTRNQMQKAMTRRFSPN